MGDLVLGLIPSALGIVLSPLAIMALVAELLSRRFRTNGVAYLIGWTIALVAVLVLALWLFTSLGVDGERAASPGWVAVVRVVIGVALVAAAVWVYRRGSHHVKKMVAAQTPG